MRPVSGASKVLVPQRVWDWMVAIHHPMTWMVTPPVDPLPAPAPPVPTWPCGSPRRPAPVKWSDASVYLAERPPHSLALTIADYWNPRGYGR
jgi:hypothetical protein